MLTLSHINFHWHSHTHTEPHHDAHMRPIMQKKNTHYEHGIINIILMCIYVGAHVSYKSVAFRSANQSQLTLLIVWYTKFIYQYNKHTIILKLHAGEYPVRVFATVSFIIPIEIVLKQTIKFVQAIYMRTWVTVCVRVSRSEWINLYVNSLFFG